MVEGGSGGRRKGITQMLSEGGGGATLYSRSGLESKQSFNFLQ